MADMQRRHHTLIEHAIKAAIDATLADPIVRDLVVGVVPFSESGERNVDRVGNRLKQHLAEEFAERLQYTQDTFDPDAFIAAITGRP